MTDQNLSPQPQLFIGIDIARNTATCASATSLKTVGKPFSFPQTPLGFTELKTILQTQQPNPTLCLVVMEATGTYWMKLALDLYQAGFKLSVINPNQAHHFAKAYLKHSKTDQLDAQTLAQLAAAFQPAPWSPPPQIYEELQQRMSQRDQLQQTRQQTLNRLEALNHRPKVIETVSQRHHQLLALLEQQLTELEAEVKELFDHSQAWQTAASRLRGVPGFGPVTVAWLLIETQAFSLCPTPQQAVALAGLAPRAYQSGTSVYKNPKLTQACRGRLRRALYMAAVASLRCNPQMKAFYHKLKSQGKPSKVALCAVARKLMVLAWTLVCKERDYDPNFCSAANTPLLPLGA